MTEKDKQEIQKLKTKINRLKKLIVKDELTGILNRRGINEEFKTLFNEAFYFKKNPGSKRQYHIKDFSIVFIDCDDFKKINDKYGHSMGDKILKKIAALINKKIRDVDLFGRIGGDEFVIALIGTDETEAYKKAEEIRQSIKSEIKIKKRDNFKITASIGVASIKESKSQNFSDLIDLADKTMYKAKNKFSKDHVVKYSEIS